MSTTPQRLDEYGVAIPTRQNTRNKSFVKPDVDMWTRLKNPLGTIYLPEILKAVSKEQLLDDKIKMIRIWWQRDSKNADVMRTMMLALYHPGVVFAFPQTRPPFLPNDASDYGMSANTLFKAVRKLKLLSEGPDKIQNQMKRENMLIQQLESLHKDEAELFLMMIWKEIDEEVYPGVNEAFLRQAFAGVLPPVKEPVSQQEDV